MSESFVPTDPKDPYFDVRHPRHDAAVAAVQERYRQRYDAPAPHPAPSPTPEGGEPPEPSAEPPSDPGEEGHELAPPPGPAVLQQATSIEDWGAATKEVGFSQELAQQLLDAVTMRAPLPELPPSSATPETGEAELRRAWGADYGTRLELARYAVKTYGVEGALSESGWGNDPRAARFFAREGARLAIRVVMGTPTHPYHHVSARGHDEAVKDVRRLYRLAQR